jgi:ATP-binding cassette subfamily B protein
VSSREARAASGGGGGRLGRGGDPDAKRPEDPALRRANTRRILALFVPYRAGLALLLSLIALTAAISIFPPFFLRSLLDAWPRPGSHSIDTGRLDLLVAGMVAIPVASGVIGVWQTWLSNRIGQDVMHDLRASVYAHLQRLSLAFFKIGRASCRERV